MPIHIKILSMDGGNGYNTAELLRQLESVDRKRFLDRTNVFTGSSAAG
jgi:patatin-like phospholipase/acyl hydrolase